MNLIESTRVLSSAIFLIISESTAMLSTTIPGNTTLSGVAVITGGGDEPLNGTSRVSDPVALLRNLSVSRWIPNVEGR